MPSGSVGSPAKLWRTPHYGCSERAKLTMVAPRVTIDLLRRYIDEGRGFGHGESYLAFIQLKRWNASPISVQTFGSVPPFARRTHFLSRSEWLLALLLAWIGCHVREQFPMWPWRSPNALHGLDPNLDEALAWSSGTISLCRALGIDHGYFVGTSIPYVWTLDLVATLAWLPMEHRKAAVVSVKPLAHETYAGDIDPIARGPEKLEVERQYAHETGLTYFVADRSLYPGHILGQLELYSSGASLPHGHPVQIVQSRLLDKKGDSLAQEPPIAWRDRLMKDWQLSQPEADLAVSNIIWNQLIDVDLTREIQMEDPVRPGGRALQQALRKSIERGNQCQR